MVDKAHWLSGKLFEMEITPPPIGEDLRGSWLNFTCDLEIAGDVLSTFEGDEDAARTIRDRLCGWARIWSRWHPEPEWRPWYGAIAIAAEAGNWEGVSRLCQALVKFEQ
jgi:hypothetical protein